MYFAPREICLRDGRTAIVRSPIAGDAASDIRCRLATASETDFLLGSPEDICTDEARHTAALTAVADDPNALLLLCIVDGDIVARMHGYVKPGRKVRHRFRLGVCVMQTHWGRGIASVMITAAEDAARDLGARQMELEVMAHNVRARALYEKLGYRIVQVKPDAICLANGRLIDEYLMIKKL